jgi:hypothetical protein
MRKVDFMLHNILFAVVLSALLLKRSEAVIFILIAQLLVGCYQVISSAIRTIRFDTLNTKTQLLIKLYWVVAAPYSIGLMVVFNYNIDNTIIDSYILSAWLIALYYHFITYKLAYPKFIKSHLDI